MHAAVYVQNFTRGESGFREKQDCVYDFTDFPHPAHRVQSFQRLMRFGFVHRSLDHSQCNSVDANAVLRILNGK